jgi:hypothetical protein
MAQIHCYLPDELASQLGKKAEKSHLSVSKYLAGLVKRDISSGWPAGYFEQVFGGWEGEVLERPEQGDYEQRERLE